MGRRRDDDGCAMMLFTIFTKSAWWMPFPVALGAYIFVGFILPLLFSGTVYAGARPVFTFFAPYAAGTVLFIALFSWLYRLMHPSPAQRGKTIFDATSQLDDLRAMHWQDFEYLVAEAYRRLGYSVTLAGGPQPDGGVDIILVKDGVRTYIQCKHWREWKVGVKIIRELYGVMTSDHVTRGIVITCGIFTTNAETFAQDKPIELIDGEHLIQLIRGIQTSKNVR